MVKCGIILCCDINCCVVLCCCMCVMCKFCKMFLLDESLCVYNCLNLFVVVYNLVY